MEYIRIIDPDNVTLEKLKHDLLLMDKICIPSLSFYIDNKWSDNLSQQVVYLINKGLVYEPEDHHELFSPLFDEVNIYKVSKNEFQELVNSGVMNSSLINQRDSAEQISNLAELYRLYHKGFGTAVYAGTFGHNTTQLQDVTEFIESYLKISVEIVNQEDQDKIFIPTYKSNKIPYSSLDKEYSNKVCTAFLDVQNYSKKSQIINFTSQALPIPNSLHSFSEILDFREEAGVSYKLLMLHNWINDMHQKNYSIGEIKEEMEFLQHEYISHVDRLSTNKTLYTTRSILRVTSQLFEAIVKGDIYKGLDSIFSATNLKNDLEQVTYAGPGKVLSYIQEVKLKFS